MIHRHKNGFSSKKRSDIFSQKGGAELQNFCNATQKKHCQMAKNKVEIIITSKKE